MLQGSATVGASRLGDSLGWPVMARAAWATRSAGDVAVQVTQTHLAVFYGEASVGDVGGALLLVFRTEHLLFNRQPRCHDLPAWVAAAASAAALRRSARDDLLQIFHAGGAQQRVMMMIQPQQR